MMEAKSIILHEAPSAFTDPSGWGGRSEGRTYFMVDSGASPTVVATSAGSEMRAVKMPHLTYQGYGK